MEMIRTIRSALNDAAASTDIRWVFFRGAGDRGFCAGGDIKAVARAVKEGALDRADQFFAEEYALDLRIHEFPKPVMVLADGITMGGGLGLSAGADVVVATERTRMAMPEGRIGFFPDVGATGWMFSKCPRGYPEYLGLTGREMVGAECVRVGFAGHLMSSDKIPEAVELLEEHASPISDEKPVAVRQLQSILAPITVKDIPKKPDMDEWVAAYFSGRISVGEILQDLRQCGIFGHLCNGVFKGISERSPTALVLTLHLLRRNEGRPLKDAFEADAKAAHFMLRHPDFLEGVRARLVDKDDRPKWKPATIHEVGHLNFEF
jgi:enoyl-CoA hydratase/carnithine racemase